MLKWTQIAENFISIDVGKEYDEKPSYRTTFYYYKGLIIDTGCPHTAAESVDFVGDRKLDVKAVLLTHYHEDHSGGAYLFKERFNVDVFAPEKSLKILANPPEIPAYRQLIWGQPKPLEALPFERKMTFEIDAYPGKRISTKIGCHPKGILASDKRPTLHRRGKRRYFQPT